MKTKIIPFDLETAKKIQAGEISGRVCYKINDYICNVRFVCFDRKDSSWPIICLYCYKEQEGVLFLTKEGSKEFGQEPSVYIEVPEEPKYVPKHEFKPFDKVLVRENDVSLWRTGFYSHELDGKHCVCGNYYPQCIPYEGNEHLLGTTYKPE